MYMSAPAVQPTKAALARAVGHRGHQRTARSVVRWVLAAAATGLLIRLGYASWAEISRAVGALVTGRSHLVALVVVLEVVWTVALSQVARNSVMAVGGRLTSGHALRISMAGFTLSRVVPGGGAAGGIFATRELVLLGNALPTALGAMIVSWTVATTSLASLVLAGTSVAAFTDDVPLAYLVPSAVVLMVLVGVGLLTAWALQDRDLRTRMLGWLERIASRLGASDRIRSLSSSFDGVAQGLRARRRLVSATAWSVLAWGSDAAALWLVFAAFGHRLTLTQLVLGYSFANLINSAPELTPGWIGVFEAAMISAYTALGVPGGIALVGVLSYRLVSFWMPVAFGVLPAISSLATQSSVPLGDGLEEARA
jgi:uncharacterized protein (TIRG00374 family)